MDRVTEERIVTGLMVASLVIVVGSLLGIIAIVIWRGLPGFSIEMLTQLPAGGYYTNTGGGGILNAIVGSFYLAGASSAIALIVSLPAAFALQKEYLGKTKEAEYIRLALDVLWGTPSIVYGAFGFIIMMYIGMRASLLGGIIVLTLLQIPIMIRAMDEVIQMVPDEIRESSYALGATRFETTVKIVLRQVAPGLVTALLLAFGRGIGDTASVLFTAGYSDTLPGSLLQPVASLPLAVFFQLGMPYPEVQEKGYTAALVLLAIVLILSLVSRYLAKKFRKNVLR